MDYFNLKDIPTEDLYKEVATIVQSTIQEDWESATVEVALDFEDAGRTFGRYKKRGDDKQHSMDTDYRIYCIFEELQIRTRKEGKNTWTYALYSLKKDGTYTIEFHNDGKTLDDIYAT